MELGGSQDHKAIFRRRQFVHKMFVHNFGPLDPLTPSPNKKSDGFSLDLVLKELPTELGPWGRARRAVGQSSPSNLGLNAPAGCGGSSSFKSPMPSKNCEV